MKQGEEMELRVVVDRIEGDLAVLEVGSHLVDWPIAALPSETKEGSTLSLVLSLVTPDSEEARARLERLRKKGPGGDVIDL